jgi:uncharacterized protein with GYD domain
MPHYLFRATYSQEGLRGLVQEGASSRTDVVRELIESLGGRMESCYWAFGADDIYIIAELPDNAAAVAAATTVGAAGTGSISTTVLLTATEIDESRGRLGAYRAPGA